MTPLDSGVTGVLRRTASDLPEDEAQLCSNFENKAWKEWPNDAGVSKHFTLTSQAKLDYHRS